MKRPEPRRRTNVKKWIQENPWLAIIIAIFLGALVFAVPIGVGIMWIKGLFVGRALPDSAKTAAANPQNQAAAQANR
jgi:membrane protein DedA with SNARE-associated domain